MDDYFLSKCKIINHLKPQARIFFPEDQKEIALKVNSTLQSFAPKVQENLPLFFQTRFNRNNLEVAVAVLESVFNFKVNVNWDLLTAPDGRFFIKSHGTNFIVVDFAHTPDALKNICQGIKEAFPRHRLKVLFGCGGDRDRSKRPLMGAVADKYGDEIIVTSDNPRSEEPGQIIDDISVGIKSRPFAKKVLRPEAVREALENLKSEEVLLLAGKGHEDYILIKGVKYPYSDIGEVENFLARKKS